MSADATNMLHQPRCQHVSLTPWGPSQCALPDGHDERHAYSPSEDDDLRELLVERAPEARIADNHSPSCIRWTEAAPGQRACICSVYQRGYGDD